MEHENVNIYLIAKEARVSIATISRYFNKEEQVKRSTREKIRKICKKYNYSPSKIASAITTRKTKTVALVTPSLQEPIFYDLIQGVEHKLYDLGYGLFLINTEGSIQKEREVIEIIKNRIIDGVIISGVYGNIEDSILVKGLDKKQIPLIFVDRYTPSINKPYVSTNNYNGSKLAVKYFLKMGHRDFGLVVYDTKMHIMKEIKRGFVDTLKEKNIKPKFILETPIKFNDINSFIIKNKETLLNKEVSAIVTGGDMIAIYLLKIFSNNRIKVPEDISIIGFDNIVFSDYTYPRLTTVEQDMRKIGEIATENLITKIEKNRYKKNKVLLNPKLIIRDSVLNKKI